MKLRTRQYVYGVALALAPLAIVYGLAEESTIPLWLALLASILVPSLALNHPTEEEKNGNAAKPGGNARAENEHVGADSLPAHED